MVLRETTFRVGGVLTIVLGIAFAFALYASGAGFAYFGAWAGAALCVGFGGFFLYVAHDERRTRRQYLESVGADGLAPRDPPGD